MRRSEFVQLAVLAVIGAALYPLSGRAQAERPLNIVVILADDYGYGSSGCYGADGKLIRTPNIDRLAREGRRFTDANTTSSVCSPTRYSLLTGRYLLANVAQV
jgi:arylsulfatase A-like enzyme